MFRTLVILGMCSFVFWFPTAYKRWTHGFRPSKCFIELPYRSAWEIDPLSQEKEQEIINILKEPFTYLSKGRQCYVFLSKDKKYVCKFFRYDARSFPYIKKLETLMRKWLGLKMKKNFHKDKHFTSHMLGYNLAQKQTGLVYVHLNPHRGALPDLIVKDRLGFTHRMDPARFRFVLQKKADLLVKTLRTNNERQPIVDSYFQLLDELNDLGLVNLDLTWGRNVGFLDGKAIQIDVGDFIYSPELATPERKAHYQNQLFSWLDRHP